MIHWIILEAIIPSQFMLNFFKNLCLIKFHAILLFIDRFLTKFTLK